MGVQGTKPTWGVASTHPHVRVRVKLYYPTVRTYVRKRSFSIHHIHLLNSLPASVACVPNGTQFKHLLNDQIQMVYTYVD